MSQLKGREIKVHFEGVKAVDGVDISVETGEVVGLIGPNGAGKTTLLNVLSGFQSPTEGRVELDGRDVTGLPPARLSRLGVVRTFQSVRVFEGLTVHENVELGFIGSGYKRSLAAQKANTLIGDLGLDDRAHMRAGALSHGDERLLGIARALAMAPRLLLLDEPAAGLNESESVQLTQFLRRLPREYDLGLLLVEHDMSVVMAVSDRVHVINYGTTLFVGSPSEVQTNAAVQDAYLGAEISA